MLGAEVSNYNCRYAVIEVVCPTRQQHPMVGREVRQNKVHFGVAASGHESLQKVAGIILQLAEVAGNSFVVFLVTAGFCCSLLEVVGLKATMVA